MACCLALAPGVTAQKKTKPKKEEVTQILQLPKELPAAVIGETRHLTFHVTPLSARGLLSAQVRDALKSLTHETGGNPILKIRAFVAGSGDLRRVRDLVSEVFTDRKQPLRAQPDPSRRLAARRRAGGPGSHRRREEGSQSPRPRLLVRTRCRQR